MDKRNDGAPPEWFTPDPTHDLIEGRLKEFTSSPPTKWAPAESEAPRAVEKWLDDFCRLKDDADRHIVSPQQGIQLRPMIREVSESADVSELRKRVRLELSVDGTPRELRLLLDGERFTLQLWAAAHVGIWISQVAMRELWGHDEDDDWEDENDYTYEPLALHHRDLTATMIQRYAEAFVRVARFPPRRVADAKETLSIMVTTDRALPLIRCTSHFTGSTMWLHDWDGSDEQAISFIDQRASDDGEWVHDDREIAGPTEWDE